MGFVWSKSQVEELFARVHLIDDGKRGAFQARLRHLQRLGVPAGSNTGKGKAAKYGPRQVASLGLALEMLQLGLSPEHASAVIEACGEVMLECVPHAASSRSSKDYTGGHQIVLIDPGGLTSLQRNGFDAKALFAIGPANQLPDFLSSFPPNYRGHLAAIDLQWLIVTVIDTAIEMGLGDPKEVEFSFSIHWEKNDACDPQA